MARGPPKVTTKIVNGLKEITKEYDDGSFETEYAHASPEEISVYANNKSEYATRNCKPKRKMSPKTVTKTVDEHDIEHVTKEYDDGFEETAAENVYESKSTQHNDEANKPTIIRTRDEDGRRIIYYDYPDGRKQTEVEEITFTPETKHRMKGAAADSRLGNIEDNDFRYRSGEYAQSWKIVDGKKEVTTRYADGHIEITYEPWDG